MEEKGGEGGGREERGGWEGGEGGEDGREGRGGRKKLSSFWMLKSDWQKKAKSLKLNRGMSGEDRKNTLACIHNFLHPFPEVGARGHHTSEHVPCRTRQ